MSENWIFRHIFPGALRRWFYSPSGPVATHSAEASLQERLLEYEAVTKQQADELASEMAALEELKTALEDARSEALARAHERDSSRAELDRRSGAHASELERLEKELAETRAVVEDAIIYTSALEAELDAQFESINDVYTRPNQRGRSFDADDADDDVHEGKMA